MTALQRWVTTIVVINIQKTNVLVDNIKRRKISKI